VDAFLASEQTCRVATISSDGPHNTPLWFVWDGTALWLNSLVRSQRWVDLQRDPRVSVVADAGEQFTQLRGVELRGSVTSVGEAPRTGVPIAELVVPERLFARKYMNSDALHYDGRHGWLRLQPSVIRTWDFRKQFKATSP
jgi:Pyridoxamine 5'-phosphate oxidase